MINIITNQNIVSTVSIGKLTNEDYEKLIPLLNKTINQFGKIRWYFEMQDFKGWELKAFWQDIKFDFQHINNFEKVAMVGEKDWEKWMTDLMKPFTPAEIKFYELQDKEKAKQWIAS